MGHDLCAWRASPACACSACSVVMDVLVYADDVADDMLVLRHEKDLNGCRGKVEDGVFKKCGCSTPVVYCFLATLSSRSSGTRCAGCRCRTCRELANAQWRRLWSLEKAHFPFSIKK